LILQAQPKGGKLPVVLLGSYKASSRFQANFLQGDIIGTSSFGVKTKSPYYMTRYALDFMGSLGINFDMPNREQMERALNEVMFMPAYPDPGCVRRIENFILVRLSDSMYD